jgi:octaprenyl-diphosphate synthase
MSMVDNVIDAGLSSSVGLVGEIAKHIIFAGGKRLRPALLLMTSGALACDSQERFRMAAVIEFIHTATLLHDDVVDESTLRRGKPTANECFGNPASVLVGDFLYSRAFQMMVQTNNMRVMEILSDATNVIAEGEVQQLMNMHNASLTADAYLHVIQSKTAKLFEASAQLGAVLSNATEPIEAACANYGRALGTAFQVIDDILDYDGDPHETGKNIGDDLREGKSTLPLIFAMQHGSADQAALLQQAIETGSVDQLPAVIDIVRQTGALTLARNHAHDHAQKAVDAALQLPYSAHRQAMLDLASGLLMRRA